MLARISVVLLAVPLLVSATAVPRHGGGGGNSVSQCNTGPVQCCNSVHNVTDPGASSLAGLLGAILGPITGQIGLNCNPIGVLGIGGNSCDAQPVCCEDNQFNGLISLGCTPINLNL